MLSSRLALYLFTLGLAIIAIVLHNRFGPQSSSDEKTTQSPEKSQHQWLTENATLWRYQPEQQTIVHADKIENDGEFSKLTKPNLYLINERGSTSIQAEKGITDKNQVINLSENVEMKQFNDQSPNRLIGQLDTSSIKYNAASDFLQTEQKVIIQNDYGTTQAIGLEADLKNAEYRLLSQVKATYHMQSEAEIPPSDSPTP
ncbi:MULTISPECIES: LPS export ABC transporter periplasmic protein LptC [Thiomicrorhabdus]|uniref:LPS export ABC transporter periplasmic protein LptC n=1 Tax=Thiomicrorhabdus heinhorstiae TaxID=2748010 RepID=A0ABS0BWP1_9GAMM|nr:MULTISPECIES: LPS export ABC transporter periplasmic protein LptC [Thiomicrorhabdus]MBF6057231.1 LPS export ABC transporter periplasmic protein LptC [Thiomicrorhabdus heinhorstiae]